MSDVEIRRLEERIAASEERNSLRLENLLTKVDGFFARIVEQNDGIRSEIQSQRAEASALRAELGTQSNALRAELGSQSNALRAEFGSQSSALRAELRADLAGSATRFEAALEKESAVNRERFWVLFGTMIAAAIGLGALGVGVASVWTAGVQSGQAIGINSPAAVTKPPQAAPNQPPASSQPSSTSQAEKPSAASPISIPHS